MNKILIIEDEPTLAEGLAAVISQYGMEPYIQKDFNSIEESVASISPHLILLDINLPKFNGFYWCLKIRKISQCPIIVISARTGAGEQIMALENGADDYICKPFYNDILIAKIRSHLRRCYGEYNNSNQSNIKEACGLRLDCAMMQLWHEANSCSLSHKESILLGALMDSWPKPADRESLLTLVWDNTTFVDENTLNVNITRIRKKLEEIGSGDIIETVRGVGYRLKKE